MNWHTRIHTDLAAQAAKQAYRRRAPRRADVPLPEIDFDDTRLLNFGGNDYLGLSRDESVIAAWQQALSRFGSGSGGSPLLSGHTDAHEALEQLLAGWLGYERALVFASGYAANQEKAEVGTCDCTPPDVPLKPLTKIPTPGAHTIEQVSAFLKCKPNKLIKTLIYVADGQPIAVLVRGDHDANEPEWYKEVYSEV